MQLGAQTGSALEMDRNQQDLSGLFQYASMELANKKPAQQVAKELVSQDAAPKEAKAIVAEVQSALKKASREKYKKRMMRGLIWTVLGLIVTCGTYVFASEMGGKYYLCYGAIILGMIDYVVGMIGWLTNG